MGGEFCWQHGVVQFACSHSLNYSFSQYGLYTDGTAAYIRVKHHVKHQNHVTSWTIRTVEECSLWMPAVLNLVEGAGYLWFCERNLTALMAVLLLCSSGGFLLGLLSGGCTVRGVWPVMWALLVQSGKKSLEPSPVNKNRKLLFSPTRTYHHVLMGQSLRLLIEGTTSSWRIDCITYGLLFMSQRKKREKRNLQGHVSPSYELWMRKH